MKKGKKFLRTKEQKVAAVICLAIVTSIATAVVSNYTKRRNVVNDLSHEKSDGVNYSENLPFETNDDDVGYIEDLPKPVESKQYTQIQESQYKLNSETKTISFSENIEEGSFCISTNPDGPDDADEWITIDDQNSYEIENYSDEVNKVYVYYMANEVTMTNYTTSATSISISNATELNRFASLVNGGDSFSGKTVILTCNITASGLVPIGTATYPFKGTFDGMGYTISGININTGAANTGLFGYVTNATIKNVTISGTQIKGTSYTGGIVGYGTGTIENCINNVPIIATGTDTVDVGGIAGQFSGVVRYCQNTAAVTGVKDASGIVGEALSDIEIFNCRNAGAINSTKQGVAGMLVAGRGKTTIKNCTNEGALSTTGDYAGGILAYSNYSADATTTVNYIGYCKNLATVAGGKGGEYGCVGGIGGRIYNVKIEYCINNSTISGLTRIGGILGSGNGGVITIQYCQNKGETSSLSGKIGGIAGQLNGLSAENYAQVLYSSNKARVLGWQGRQSYGGSPSHAVAGIVGIGSQLDIDGCYLLVAPGGAITQYYGAYGYRYIAGIVNFSQSDSNYSKGIVERATVKNCYAAGRLGIYHGGSSSETKQAIANWVWYGYYQDGAYSNNYWYGTESSGHYYALYIKGHKKEGKKPTIDATTFKNDAGGIYYSDTYNLNVAVSSKPDADFVLNWEVTPIIIRNPFNVIKPVGTTAQLNIIDNGGKNTYQWYMASSEDGAGTAVPGATSSTYTATVQSTVKWYYCIVNGVTANGTPTSATSKRAVVGNGKFTTNVNDLTVNLSQTTYTYDGNAKTPTVTVYDGSTKLTNGVDYTFKYSNNVNAGTAKVTITGKEAYEGTRDIPFTINKASRTITMNASLSATYGTNQSLSFSYTGDSVTATATSSNTAAATVSISNTTRAGTITVSPVAAGSTTVTLTVPGNGNYNQAQKTCAVTVNRITGTMTVSTSTLAVGTTANSFTYTYNGNATPTVSSSNTSVATVEINTSTKTVTVTPVANGTATITVSAAQTGQYTAASKTVTATITKTATITINPNEGYYGANKSAFNTTGDIGSTLSLITPIRSGYKFTGWTKSGGGTLNERNYYGITASAGSLSVDSSNDLVFRANTSSAYFNLSTRFNTSQVKKIRLVLDNNTSATTARIQFRTATGATATGTKTIQARKENQVLLFDFSGTANWASYITSLQFTPGNAAGNYVIEKIEFLDANNNVYSIYDNFNEKGYSYIFANATATLTANWVAANYSVNGNYYATLASACAAINGSSGTINVEQSNTDTSAVTIASGKTITLNTNGKTITRSSTITNNGELLITGSGTIVSSSGNTLTNSGTLKVLGTSTIKSTNGIAITNSGTVVVGVNDTILNKSITVQGNTYGYYASSSSAKLEIYDGVLKGKTAAYSGNVAAVQSGYGLYKSTETIDSATYQTAYLVKGWDISKTAGTDNVWAFLVDNTAVSGTYIMHIQGKGAMKDFADYPNVPWVDYRSSIYELRIDEGITSVGDRAFYNFNQITAINLPTTLTYIGTYSFYNCTKVTGTITIPKAVTSMGTNPFLTVPTTNISVASGNTAFKSSNGVLYNYAGTQLIAYPYGKTDTSYTVLSTATQINTYACYGMKATSVTLPSGLKTISSCAFQTSKLTSVTIPSGVTSIGGNAFNAAASLGTVYLKSTTLSTLGSSSFTSLKSGSIIYTMSKSIADKFTAGTTYTSGTTSIYYPPVLNTQPANKSISVGSKATFTVAATVGNPTTINYQWQYRTSSSGTWTNVTSSQGTGGTTASFTTVAAVIGMNGYQYRCIISNSAYPNSVITQSELSSSLISNAATLTVSRLAGHVTLSATNENITYGTASKTFTVTSHHGGALSVKQTTNTAATVSISGTTVTISNTGSLVTGTKVTVRVTSAQTDTYNSAYADYTLTIIKANRSITMSKTMTLTYGANGSLAFSYTGEDVTATATSSNTGVATVAMSDGSKAGTITVTPKKAGTSTVTLTVPASTNYNQATAECTVTVNRATGYVKLSATNENITYGTTSKTFTVASYHGGALSVAETTSTAATVAISGTTITISNTGNLVTGTKVTVRVTSAQTDTHTSASADYTLTVIKANRTITMNKTMTVVYGETGKLSFSYTGEDVEATAVSSNTGVVTVSMSDGTKAGTITVTPVKFGTSTVTLTVPASTNYNQATAECVVTSKRATGYIDLSATNESIVYGTTSKAFTVTRHHGGTLSAVQTTDTAATVEINGTTVTISNTGNLNAGTKVIVRVTSAQTDTHEAAYKDYTLTIIRADRTITMNSTMTVTYGTNGNLAFSYTGEDVTATVTSSNTGAATVKMNDEYKAGTITVIPVAAGTSTITLTIPESTNYNKTTKTCALTVNRAKGFVNLNETSSKISYGTASKEIIVVSHHGGNLSATTSHGSVKIDGEKVTVSGLGSIPAGTLITVKITSAQTPQYYAETVTHEITVIKADRTITMNDKMTVTYGTNGSLAFSYTGEDVTATIVSTDPDVASVTMNDGTKGGTITVTPWAAGTSTLTLTVPETSNYNSKTATCVVTVNRAKGHINLSESTSTIVYGTASKEFTVTSHHGGTISATTTHGSVSIDGVNIKVTGLASVTAGTTVTVTVTSGQTPQYYAESATHKITVIKANRTITMDSKITVTYETNGSLAFSYTGEDVTALATSSNTGIASVTVNDGDKAGTITVIPVAAGTCTVTLTVPASTNYNQATATCAVTVNRAAGHVTLNEQSSEVPYKTASKTFTITSHHGGVLSVVETTNTAAVVSLSGTTVTISNTGNLNAGTQVVVKVTSAQTPQYYEASSTYTLTIIKANINPKVTMSGYTYAGIKSEPSLTGNPENGGVTYYYNTSNSNSGGRPWQEVTDAKYLNAGIYYMYATVDETPNYNSGISEPVEFIVARATPTLTIEKETARIVHGNTEMLSYVYDGDGDLTVTSSDTTKATASIDTNPTNMKLIIDATGVGTATITIHAAQGTNYLAKTASVVVTVAYANYSIDGIYYETLNEAYNSIKGDSATIKVERDHADSSLFVIATEKNITIDLNGKTITRANAYIDNYGKLTIGGTGEILTFMDTDLILNRENATLEIKDSAKLSHTNTKQLHPIVNYGTVTLNDSATLNSMHRAIHSYGKIIMNSGNILSEGDAGVRISNSGSIEMNGGYISSNSYGIYSDSTAAKAITMTGGTIETTLNGILLSGNTQVDITGGTISVSASIPEINHAISMTNGILNISGNTNITASNSGTGQSRGINVTNGVVNITGGTITAGTYGITNEDSAIVNISGTANINGDLAGVIIASTTKASATVNITGGTITSNSYGIWNNGVGKAIIGNNDGTISNTSPVIQGDKYGYYASNANAVVEFYDGILKGKEEANSGTITKVPNGYGIHYSTEGDYKTAVLRPYLMERELVYEDYNYTEGMELEEYQEKDGSNPARIKSYYALGAADRAKNKNYTANKITGITLIDTRDTAKIPTTYEATWDVSSIGDGSIKAWVVKVGTDKYHLYIGSAGKILAPANSRELFRHYNKATEISGLSNLDTSYVSNMMSMFWNCDELTSLDISTFDTSNVVTFSYFIGSCEKLSDLKLSDDFVRNKATNISYMFNGNSSLTALDVSKWNTSNVTNMEGVFVNCSSLSTLDVSNWDTANVTNMQNVFYGCSKLSTLNVSKWNTGKVTNMSQLFRGCSQLATLDVSKWNTANVTNMSTMFYNCNTLGTLDVSKWNTANVTNMSSMFSTCSNLTELDVSNFVTSKVTTMAYMFNNCNKLETINAGNFNTSNVTNMIAMFANCSNLKNVDISNFNTSKVKSMGAMFKNCTSLTHLDLSSFNLAGLDGVTGNQTVDEKGITYINNNTMLYGCENLKNVVLGNNFGRINGTNMFSGCTNLKAIIAQSESPMTLSTDTGVKTMANTVIFVPSLDAETNYEGATNYSSEFGNERIRPILELIGEQVIDVLRSQTYTEEGATVAKYTIANSNEYTQYGYELIGPVISTEGVKVDEIDTWQDTTYKITYTLKYKGKTVMTATRTINIYRLQASLTLSTKEITVIEGNKEYVEYEYSGDGTINLTIDTNIATVENDANKFVLEGVGEGTTELKIVIPGITYTDITDSVKVTVLNGNYSITKEDGTRRNYHVLQHAVDEAESGDTIVVLDNVTETGNVIVEKDIIIDLGENKITTDESIIIEENGKLTILGEGEGSIQNTQGTAIENNGTLILGHNQGTDEERKPTIEGYDYAVRSDNGEFIFESGTLIGTIEPPYTGNPNVFKEYYIKIEKDENKYKAIIEKDHTEPRIYAEDIEKIVCGSGKEITFNIFVEEPESKMDPDQFTLEDLIFEINGKAVTPEMSELIYISEEYGTYKYELTFKGIRQDGELTIRMEADKVFNIANMGNVATTIIEGKITIDYEAPDLSDAVLEFVFPEDGITTDGEYEVKISGVTDNHGIHEYEWQIKKKAEETWEMLTKIQTEESFSSHSGKVDDEDIYEIRVVIVDKHGNYGYSNILELVFEKINVMDTKPSIRFEKEIVRTGTKVTSVKIHAIVKSTTNIVSASVNNNAVEISDVVVEGKYQIRTDIIYEALANTMYKFTVIDENNNTTSEIYNVSDISKEGAKVGYTIVNATTYEPAKIVFTSKEDIRLVTELTGRFYAAEDKLYNKNYYREIIVNVSGDTIGLDDTFIFEDTIGNKTSVSVIGDIETADRKIVTVSSPAKTIYDVYGKQISLGRANSLVLKMKNARKTSDGKVSSYYGVDFTEVNVAVSTDNDLRTIEILGAATKVQVKDENGKIVDLTPGHVDITTEAQRVGGSVNGNKTGIFVGSNLVTGGGNEDKTGASFHVTIVNK